MMGRKIVYINATQTLLLLLPLIEIMSLTLLHNTSHAKRQNGDNATLENFVSVRTGEIETKCSGDYSESPVTSLQVLQASRLAAAAAAARQHAFYSRVLGMSRPASDDHRGSPQPAVLCSTSTDSVNSAAFRPVSARFHPYDRRL